MQLFSFLSSIPQKQLSMFCCSVSSINDPLSLAQTRVEMNEWMDRRESWTRFGLYFLGYFLLVYHDVWSLSR